MGLFDWRKQPLRGLVIALAMASAQAYALPTPTYGGVTVNGTSQINGNENVTGAFKAQAGGQLNGTFTGATILSSVIPTLTPMTQAGLSAITANGAMVFVTDCPNGSQSGGGVSGCPAFRDSAGTWRLMSTPSALPITIGGQAVTLGGVTTNQGTGSKLQLAAGSFVAGNALVFDAAGNAVDSGVVPSGGTGGGGTVAPGSQGSIASYLNAGTSSTVGPIPIVANAVIATNSGGIASEVTTLPTGLTLPGATLPNPTLTGSVSIGTASYSGKQTFLASVSSSAGLNVPAGVAPSAPAAGDIWATSSGLFYRTATTSEGPLLFSAATTAPLTGGGSGPSLTLACPTCATTTNGGALSAVSPLAITAGGQVTLGTIFKPVTWLADSTTVVHNDTYPLFKSPWTNAAPISQIVYHTGGTGSPSFVATLNTCTGQSGGAYTGCSAVPNCNNISVSSATDNTISCTGGSLPSGQYLNLIISGTTGTPSSAWFETVVAQPAS